MKGNEKNTDFLKELLVQYIQSFHVLGAIEVYGLLEKTPRGMEKLDDDIKQELLELLCYHNNEEEMDKESHTILDGMFRDDREVQAWSPDGLAERLYAEIVTSEHANENRDSIDRARLAVICGIGKFHQVSGDSRMASGKQSKKGRVLQLKEQCKVWQTLDSKKIRY